MALPSVYTGAMARSEVFVYGPKCASQPRSMQDLPNELLKAASRAEAALRTLDSSLELGAALECIQILHSSAYGSALFAGPLQAYATESASDARAEALLDSCMFMPALTALACGKAQDELQLDRCARVVLVDEVGGRRAVLDLTELKMNSSSGEYFISVSPGAGRANPKFGNGQVAYMQFSRPAFFHDT